MLSIIDFNQNNTNLFLVEVDWQYYYFVKMLKSILAAAENRVGQVTPNETYFGIIMLIGIPQLLSE